MQLLHASGLEIMHDGVRESDISNPEGYYELEAVKGIVKDNSFLNDAAGKVIKIVAPLPIYMNPELSYRVVFMRRDIDEILRSQERMLNKDQSSEREKFRTIYEFHLKKTYAFFKENEIPFIDVNYNDLMRNPEPILGQLIAFADLPVTIDKLMGVVKPDLYRNRNEK